MRRLLLVAVLAALAVPAVARAHVTVLPTFLEAGKPVTITITAPNERPPHAFVDLTIAFPRGVELTGSPSPRGWQLAVARSSARWSGGRVGPGGIGQFKIAARTDLPPGTTTVYSSQSYDDGESVRWEIPFTMVPASNSPREHIWPAVFAAAAGFILIIGGLVIVRRRRPG